MLIVIGLLLVVLVTAVTGYFVAQEFSYVAVDRGRLRREADTGDPAAARALLVTERLSFVLSGAQLGITVTALIVGYVAEPFLGEGLAALLGRAGVPAAVSLPLSIVLALLVATVVQMVLGELAPKNLAIARAETLAKALSRSTLLYLKIFGPVIRVFDKAAGGLLRRIGIEPIEELSEGATEEDLEQIIAESRADGQLDDELSALLDHGLDFRGRTASEAMVPRVDVHTVAATATAADVVALFDTGRSRFPVRGSGAGYDEIIGVIGIADILTVPPGERATTAVTVHVIDDPETFFRERPGAALGVLQMTASRLDGLTQYLVDVKRQFAGNEDHMAMIDRILDTLVHHQAPRPRTGSARDPEGHDGH